MHNVDVQMSDVFQIIENVFDRTACVKGDRLAVLDPTRRLFSDDLLFLILLLAFVGQIDFGNRIKSLFLVDKGTAISQFDIMLLR